MLKIFSQKLPQSKVKISDKISPMRREQLLQARGVIDNYLRDKKCTVNIQNYPLYDEDYLEISALSNSNKSFSRVSILKDSDKPFLRQVYKAIEVVTKNI